MKDSDRIEQVTEMIERHWDETSDDIAQQIDQLYRKQWISVDDMLPVSGKTILVWYRVNQLPYDTHVGISTYRGRLNGLITHWMPLPSPP
jgi:hypothetical protein